MNNLTILIYYIYALLVIFFTGYIVFVLDHSGFWFLLTLLFLNITPNDK